MDFACLVENTRYIEKFVLSYIEYFMRKYDLILFCRKINMWGNLDTIFSRGYISVTINNFCRNFLLDFLPLIIARLNPSSCLWIIEIIFKDSISVGNKN